MHRQSPPKHRHDGTSPLPLGMDWSPPPRKWNGRDTIWPHDPRTGWSYCVTIPSWVVRPKSRDSDPVVFYRVQVGIQSPEGITTSRGVFRRFNDFLKLFTVLRKALPKKSIPPAPPKGLLRMKNRVLLEERRCSLEEWMGKLLSDLDISRSVAVASFLELEAAARSSYLEENLGSAETNHSSSSTTSSVQAHPNSSPPLIYHGASLMSDYGSDTAYEASEIGTSSLGRDNNSEVGTEDFSLDDDLTNPIEKFVKYSMSNIDEGLFMGQAIVEQLEGFPRHKILSTEINAVLENGTKNGHASKSVYNGGDALGLLSEQEHSKAICHSRKLSNERVGSEMSSVRDGELSIGGFPNSFGNGSLDPHSGAEVLKTMEILGNAELQFSGGAQLILPLDNRQKMHRALMTMQRRLVTAKSDIENLVSRLNQETAVKDYLTTKVTDLEVELESNKQKSKENLQQAILIEKERVTQMQWDMEELRRKSLEMELKLKLQQDGALDSEPKTISLVQDKDALSQELDVTKQQLDDLLKRHQDLESKSKADIKVLVKEVKSLRSSQAELKLQLYQSLKEKSEMERILELEKQKQENAKTARRKMLRECKILLGRLQDCKIKLLEENTDKLFMDSASLPEALDLLTTSDNQIAILLGEARLLANDDGHVHSSSGESNCTGDDDESNIDNELRKMLKEIFTDNARLRKQVNSKFRTALKLDISSEKDGNESSSKQVLHSMLMER